MRSRKCCGCGWEWRDCRRRAIAIAAHCGLDRKTVRRYVEAAQVAGLRRDDDVAAS